MGEGKTEKTAEPGAGSLRNGRGPDPDGGLFERETELAALSAALAAARAGAGGLVVLEGPAGIGKSRLLAEASAMADVLGLAVLTARGIDLERDAPFGIAADLFAPALTNGGLAKADRTESAAARARLLSGQAALAGALFDPVAPPSADSSALVRGLYWLTVNVAASAASDERPGGVLIEVDDAQWADRPSLSYLAYLAARIDELPAVLVIAVRSGEQATDQQTLDWLRDRAGRSLLRPRALGPESITGMACAEFPNAERAFTQACAEASGGNPFLATELLRALRADGIAPTADSVARVRSLVPDSVLRAVLVRLARLGEPAEQLAKAVAVLGNRAPMRQARTLAGLAAMSAEQAADALASAHIMAPGDPLRFTHPLIAASVYADIPAFARARAHRLAADLLAADGAATDAVVAQLLLTRPDGDQRTVSTLRETAARALTRGDPAAAARLLNRALAEPPRAQDRGQVLLELANAEIEQGDQGAARHIDEALPLLESSGDRVSALAALGRLRFNLGAHEAAASVMEQALELLEPDDPALPPLLVGYLTASTFRAG
ncbi:MAG: AAA family ATPase, partial [Trebonia sp.]